MGTSPTRLFSGFERKKKKSSLTLTLENQNESMCVCACRCVGNFLIEKLEGNEFLWGKVYIRAGRTFRFFSRSPVR